jgi:hypothetical protein
VSEHEPCRVCVAVVASLLAGVIGAASAEPLTFWGGRVRLGGDVSGTIAPEDYGFFNYNDYKTSTLRLFRIDLAAEVQFARAASLIGEVRSDNVAAPRVYALYMRLRPWSARAFDIQAGLVPPVFGAFARRRYAYDNPLPSLPLAYQYLTSLRADAVPANAEQLVAQRGRGWLVRYPIGSTEAAAGIPLVNAERWDAGVQVRLGQEPVSLALAVTQGTLSYPGVRDENDGKQVSGRLAWTPGPAFTVGVSGATGPFLSRVVTDALPPSAQGDFRQKALGADVECARGYWILRGEALWSRWNLPAVEPTLLTAPLDALGLYGEVRYKIRPGLYVAGRAEHLAFGELDTTSGRTTWEAPVTRFEVGAGFTIRRWILLKASWQHNRRDGGGVRENDLVATQLLVWF